MMAIVPREKLRVCEQCSEIRSLTDFRRRYLDRPDRMKNCNRCHAERERERRRRRREKCEEMQIQRFVSGICNVQDLERRRLIVDSAIQSFGGIDKFLKSWLGAIESLVARRKYSPRSVRFFECLMELQTEQNRRRRAALENASDEDLKALIDERLSNWIEDDPELVLMAASKLGWTIIPPREPVTPADSTLAG
jgi:hypothetical protein